MEYITPTKTQAQTFVINSGFTIIQNPISSRFYAIRWVNDFAVKVPLSVSDKLKRVQRRGMSIIEGSEQMMNVGKARGASPTCPPAASAHIFSKKQLLSPSKQQKHCPPLHMPLSYKLHLQLLQLVRREDQIMVVQGSDCSNFTPSSTKKLLK